MVDQNFFKNPSLRENPGSPPVNGFGLVKIEKKESVGQMN